MGKMPTTRQRRLSSLFRRSSGLVDQISASMVKRVSVEQHLAVHDVREAPFEAAHRLTAGLPFLPLAFEMGNGSRLVTGLGEGNHVERTG